MEAESMYQKESDLRNSLGQLAEVGLRANVKDFLGVQRAGMVPPGLAQERRREVLIA